MGGFNRFKYDKNEKVKNLEIIPSIFQFNLDDDLIEQCFFFTKSDFQEKIHI